MDFRQIFLPKDTIFKRLFHQMSENTLRAALLFEQMVFNASDEDRADFFKQLKSIERANDDVSHDVIVELSQNFLTPFDREDIHALAQEVDEVINFIYAAAKKIKFYQFPVSDHNLRKALEPIKISCMAVSEAIELLQHIKETKKISKCIKKISTAEKDADDIFDLSIAELFEHTEDFKELIKRREVYQYLESITDQCKKVGNIISTISIKYA